MIVFYTDKFIPERFAALNFGPVSFIRPKYKDDVGLYEHEAAHFEQWIRFFVLSPIFSALLLLFGHETPYWIHLAILVFFASLHGVLYVVFQEYRLYSEVEAYKEQMKAYPDDRSNKFAEYLSTKYDLDLTKDEALKELIN